MEKQKKTRVGRVLRYVTNLVKERRIGFLEDDDYLGPWTPNVVGRRDNGGLRLELIPHLRHY